MTTLEEPEPSLEEKIGSLRQQGLKDDDVVREIFRDNFDADVNEICRITGMEKLQVGRIKGQVSRQLKRKEERAKPSAPPSPEPPEPLYKTEPDVNSILEEILRTHPDVPTKVKDEIMDWANRRGSLDPGFVAWLLSSMRGISSTTAHVVSQKYALALQKAQMEGNLQLPVGYPLYPAQMQQPSWGFPTTILQGPQGPPQPLPPSPPGSGPQTGYGPSWGQPWYPPQQPPTDVRTAIREELDRREREGRPKEDERYVDIDDPVRDREGNVILGPGDKPIMKHTRVPASQVGQLVAPGEDVEEKFARKMKLYKDLFGSKEELTESKIREIIRQEQPPATSPEKAVTPEEVKAAAAEAASTAVKSFIETHEKEDKDERRHRELLNAVREGTSAKTVEGYRDDGFRFLGQGIHELAQKKPIEVIVRDGGRLLFGGSPEKEIEPGAGLGLFERFKQRGWVTET